MSLEQNIPGVLMIPDTLQFADDETLAELCALTSMVIIQAPREVLEQIRYFPPPVEPLLWEGDYS